MKKEYFLLIIAIIGLSAYLFFNNQNQSSYLLPEFDKIDKAEIDRIEITKDNNTIECFKDNGKWVLTQKKFLGNEQMISEMIASISNLTITTLISKKENLKRYDLEKGKAIKVIAKSSNKTLREFNIGKIAPTQKHTFVTLNNKKNVFHASGNLQRMFNKTIDNLRDKQIQKFDKASIKSMEISKGDLKKTISEIETPEATDLLETLSDLKCSSYIEDQTKADYKNKTSLLTIKLKTEPTDDQAADQAYEIAIFPKTEQDKYIGISSLNDYVFILQDYITDDIISNTDKLLNIKSEKANEKNS